MAVIIPDMARSFKENRHQELVRLWQSSTAKSLMILAPVMAFILVMAPQIMRILFSSRYSASSYPFRVYALMLPLRATTFGSVLMATGHPRVVTQMAALGLLLNAGVSILLVIAMGPTGAAWGTSLVTYPVVAFAIFRIARILGRPVGALVEWNRLGRILASACAPAIVVFGLQACLPRSDIVSLLISASLFMLLLPVAYKISGVLHVRYAQLCRAIPGLLRR
jgi:O-antigen/teichoic acid export membrane protein